MTRPSLPVVFTATAQHHVERARIWWAENRPAAPEAILDELRAGLELVASQPSCGVPVANARLQGVRRILLRRIDYFLGPRVSWRSWRDLYRWLTERAGRSPWARTLAEYFETFESRMVAEDCSIPGTLTMFDGLRFGSENPYTYRGSQYSTRMCGTSVKCLSRVSSTRPC